MSKTTDRRQRILDIQWDVPGMPTLVGPFDTEAEADRWAVMNIPNGSWEIRPLGRPYARTSRRLPMSAEVSS